ncbi:MAG: ATP-binding protein [Actinomycetota bacterium]
MRTCEPSKSPNHDSRTVDMAGHLIEPPDGPGIHVPPDPRLITAVGTGHSLRSAVADLIDNSVDANARNVLVRFLVREAAVEGLMIIDDGRGMNEAQMNKAMKYGGQDSYEPGALGHFGIGLKASSMSQGDQMAVYSRRDGYVPQGRWMSKASVDAADPVVVPYSASAVETTFANTQASFDLSHGTIVVVTEPRNFVSPGNSAEVSTWLGNSIDALDKHLGAVHHRAIDSGRVSIWIDQFDIDWKEAGGLYGVSARDPFDYPVNDTSGFPQTCSGSIEGIDFTFDVHVWPANLGHLDNFLVDDTNGSDGQGFYIYREGRLLQAGGWNALFTSNDDRRFVRVALEVSEDLEPYVRMNPEKYGIEFTGPFRQAVLSARNPMTGKTLADLFDDAKELLRISRTRKAAARTIVRPAGGLDRRIVEAMGENFGFDEHSRPASIVWERLSPKRVFEVVPDERKLILNLHYHDDLTKLGGTGKPAGPKQAPLLTTLIYLLSRQDLERTNAGARWRAEQEAIQNILRTALESQREWETRMGLHRQRNRGKQ